MFYGVGWVVGEGMVTDIRNKTIASTADFPRAHHAIKVLLFLYTLEQTH